VHVADCLTVAFQVLANGLTFIEQFIRDKTLMLTFEPFRSITSRHLALPQRLFVYGVCVWDPSRVGPVLKQFTHHLFVDGFLPLPKRLNVGTLIQPRGNIRITEFSSGVQPKCAPYERSRTWVYM